MSNFILNEKLRRALGRPISLLGRRLAGDAMERRRIGMRGRMQPRFWVLVLLTTAMVFAASFGVLQHRYAQGERQLNEIRAYRDSLRAQADAAADRLEYAQTDAYIERVARDELGMIMPGEVRYVNGAN